MALTADQVEKLKKCQKLMAEAELLLKSVAHVKDDTLDIIDGSLYNANIKLRMFLRNK